VTPFAGLFGAALCFAVVSGWHGPAISEDAME